MGFAEAELSGSSLGNPSFGMNPYTQPVVVVAQMLVEALMRPLIQSESEDRPHMNFKLKLHQIVRASVITSAEGLRTPPSPHDSECLLY